LFPAIFDDYISVPKANNYQSIHTIVMNEDMQRIEIQIRTKEMHDIAEYGVAAHWSYKQGFTYNIDGSQYRWVRQLLDILENSSDPEEVLENAALKCITITCSVSLPEEILSYCQRAQLRSISLLRYIQVLAEQLPGLKLTAA
jgi:(p)ppGpp synthase/HD superfamily hydrolase